MFLLKISSSEQIEGSVASACEENLRKAAVKDTCFENETLSYGFYVKNAAASFTDALRSTNPGFPSSQGADVSTSFSFFCDHWRIS
jgi:hypothetical protein